MIFYKFDFYFILNMHRSGYGLVAILIDGSEQLRIAGVIGRADNHLPIHPWWP